MAGPIRRWDSISGMVWCTPSSSCAIRTSWRGCRRCKSGRDAESDVDVDDMAQMRAVLEALAAAGAGADGLGGIDQARTEEHTSELQSLMRNSYAAFCMKKKK